MGEIKKLIDIQSFRNLLDDSIKKDGKKMYLTPKRVVEINEDFVHNHEDEFIKGIKTLNKYMLKNGVGFEMGPSYTHMTEIPGYHLEQSQAITLMGIGEVLRLWQVFPGENDVKSDLLKRIGRDTYICGHAHWLFKED